MPTYEYKCKDCGHRFDAFQNMTDDPLTECETCGGSVKRLIGTGAGIIFKGSGFYCTDYRSDSYQQSARKEKGNGDSQESGSSKSEAAKTKPEKKKAANEVSND